MGKRDGRPKNLRGDCERGSQTLSFDRWQFHLPRRMVRALAKTGKIFWQTADPYRKRSTQVLGQRREWRLVRAIVFRQHACASMPAAARSYGRSRAVDRDRRPVDCQWRGLLGIGLQENGPTPNNKVFAFTLGDRKAPTFRETGFSYNLITFWSRDVGKPRRSAFGPGTGGPQQPL